MSLFKSILTSSVMLGFIALGLDASAQTGADSSTTVGTPTAGAGSLDAEAAFSQVERGDTVGSTGNSGSGFSSAGSSSATAGRGTTSFGGFGGSFGGFGGLQQLFGGFGAQGQNSQPAIRTRLRAAINLGPISTASVQQRVGDRFQQLSRPEFKAVRVKVDEGRGTLTGVVSSQRERRMSELLLRLEPGIRHVDNQLQVKGKPSE